MKYYILLSATKTVVEWEVTGATIADGVLALKDEVGNLVIAYTSGQWVNCWTENAISQHPALMQGPLCLPSGGDI